MKAIKRWVYYCDFCKKKYFQKARMEHHEKHCTANPNRSCRVCDFADTDPDKLKELINIIKLYHDKIDPVKIGSIEEDEKLLRELEKISTCPACLLAAYRQSGNMYFEYDYKKYSASFWKDYNDANPPNIY